MDWQLESSHIHCMKNLPLYETLDIHISCKTVISCDGNTLYVVTYRPEYLNQSRDK